MALCTFIAGLTAAAAMFDSVGSDDPIVADLSTGGLLTLTIAGLLAAVSTGVMQAGGIIDQRTQYRALHLAGTDLTVMHAARLRQTAIPLRRPCSSPPRQHWCSCCRPWGSACSVRCPC
ncbi:hypothetical protein [Sanguibacter sp. Z1732]|uniref:hypothetical protein n=1 Tax=Sanguibacter sp. Z1732 TaxID=3435412 RepID=UPI003D9C9D57